MKRIKPHHSRKGVRPEAFAFDDASSNGKNIFQCPAYLNTDDISGQIDAHVL